MKEMFFDMMPPYEMLNIFVVPSCETVGRVRDPETPRMLFPLKMFPATQSVTFVSDTVPPDVYPAGMETVPAFVPIVPLVEPLFAIDPLTEPLAPYALFPVKRCSAEKSAEAVS